MSEEDGGTLNLIDLIFVACELVLVSSYLFRNMLVLRIVTVFGQMGYCIGGSMAGSELPGMKALIVFSAISALINIAQATRLIAERLPAALPESIKDIHSSHFHMMTAAEFRKLYRLSETRTCRIRQRIAVQGEPMHELSVVLRGTVDIVKDDRRIAALTSGSFVGEMSFVAGGHAMATVEVADDQTECIVWDKEKLKLMVGQDADLYRKLKQAIAIDLVKKLDDGRGGRLAA